MGTSIGTQIANDQSIKSHTQDAQEGHDKYRQLYECLSDFMKNIKEGQRLWVSTAVNQDEFELLCTGYAGIAKRLASERVYEPATIFSVLTAEDNFKELADTAQQTAQASAAAAQATADIAV